MPVSVALNNNVKWSGHFPFLFITQLKIRLHGREEFICGAIWICGLSRVINQITSLRKWMLNDYKSTRQNKSRNTQYSV